MPNLAIILTFQKLPGGPGCARLGHILARRVRFLPLLGPLWRSHVAPLAPFSVLCGLFGLRPWHSCSAFWLSVSNFGVFFAPFGSFWSSLVACWPPFSRPDPRNTWFYVRKTYNSPKSHFPCFSLPRSPKSSQKAPKDDQKATQGRPKELQNLPKGAQRAPKATQRHPQSSPKVAKVTQNDAQGTQRRPKAPQSHPKEPK